MSNLSQQPLSRPLEDTTWPTKSASFLLIAGGILIAASLFLPWLHLSTSFGDGPHEFDFDPWTAIHFNAANTEHRWRLCSGLDASWVWDSHWQRYPGSRP
jgi:hypothetical protein